MTTTTTSVPPYDRSISCISASRAKTKPVFQSHTTFYLLLSPPKETEECERMRTRIRRPTNQRKIDFSTSDAQLAGPGSEGQLVQRSVLADLTIISGRSLENRPSITTKPLVELEPEWCKQ